MKSKLVTQCPYPDCNALIELSGCQPDKRGHFRGACTSCARDAAFRTLEAMESVRKAFEKRVSNDAVLGGPELDGAPRLSVIVEDVRSLWNVGSIFRTADGAGFQMIHLCGITGAPPRREIEKVSLGAEKTVAWQCHINPLTVIDSLKEAGTTILGLEVTDSSGLLSDALQRGVLSAPLCLVIGNEVSGLSPQVLTCCDRVVHLPMKGTKESLNVAVAFGVAAYALAQQLP